jgi:hypothetical protein
MEMSPFHTGDKITIFFHTENELDFLLDLKYLKANSVGIFVETEKEVEFIPFTSIRQMIKDA